MAKTPVPMRSKWTCVSERIEIASPRAFAEANILAEFASACAVLIAFFGFCAASLAAAVAALAAAVASLRRMMGGLWERSGGEAATSVESCNVRALESCGQLMAAR